MPTKKTLGSGDEGVCGDWQCTGPMSVRDDLKLRSRSPPWKHSLSRGCMGWAHGPMGSFEIKARRDWPPDRIVAVVDRLVCSKKST